MTLTTQEARDLVQEVGRIAANTASVIGLDVEDLLPCGGCVRDLIHHRRPKDIDMVYLCNGPLEDGEDLDEYLHSLRHRLLDGGYTGIEVHESYRHNEGLVFVVKAKSPEGWDIDIICYGPSRTPRQTVTEFDVNLNSVYIAYDTVSDCYALVIEPEAAAVLAGVEPIRPYPTCSAPTKRLQYMQEKFPQYPTSEALVCVAV